MGRQVMRVPLNFNFPLNTSFRDFLYKEHMRECTPRRHDKDECGWNWRDHIPVGDGWQLWQTVSDGPVTPVFATPEELIDYMSQPVPVHERPHYAPEPFPTLPAGKGWKRSTAEMLVKSDTGWIPSAIGHMSPDGRMRMNTTNETVRELHGDKDKK